MALYLAHSQKRTSVSFGLSGGRELWTAARFLISTASFPDRIVRLMIETVFLKKEPCNTLNARRTFGSSISAVRKFLKCSVTDFE